MKLHIQAFGIAKEILGSSRIEHELPDPGTVEQLLASLKSVYPDFEKLASLMVAVNTEYAEASQQLQESDEVVLIPPVSGG
jgi:molybdopterin converting factor subunit 1